MQLTLELVRSIQSRHPGEIEALYRRGDKYVYVWIIRAYLPDGVDAAEDGRRSWTSGGGSA
jgi:hypothetical protein